MRKFCFFFLLFCIPFFVSAKVDYTVENVVVDAQILENGDMHVKELIVLDGTFHGYIRDITYENNKLTFNTPPSFSQDAIYNATDITDMKVFAKKLETKASYDTFDEDFSSLSLTYSSSDSNGIYKKSSIKNGYSYKMYYSSDEEQVAFYLDYIVKDVVVSFIDTADFYWTFIGDAFDDEIQDIKIRVTLPFEDDDMRVWGHGDLNANVQILDSKTVEATAHQVYPNSPLDIRLTFDNKLLNDVSKQSSVAALEGILTVEEKRAREANALRKKAKIATFIVRGASAIYLIGLISYFIYANKKYFKKLKPEFQLEYNREFIDDYNVEVIDYLMKNTVSENAMSASILNLVYKKNIKVDEITSEKEKKKVYQFTLINRDGINHSEEKLIQFLFEKVGKGETFTTKELESYASSTKTYITFSNTYTSWKQSVIEDGKREKFFADVKEPVSVSFIFLGLCILLIFVNMAFNVFSVSPWICMAFSVFFLFYCAFKNPKTQKGVEHYARWKAFQKFLNDFGNFKVKELPEIALWERYLVYATVFGLAKKVEKAMSVKIHELGIDQSSIYYPTWIDYSFANSISHSINQSFSSNRTTYSRLSSSSFSSGSGGGGGFSSGGGFGGGGGGGRGF